MDYWQLLLLGSIAGFTIFLGLPLAVLQNLNPRKKGFLNAFAIGILVFLIIDVFSHAWESAEGAANDAIAGKSSLSNAIVSLLAMFGGLGIGLLGLTWYESRYMRRRRPTQSHRMFFGAEEQGGTGGGVVTTSSSSGDYDHHHNHNERRQ